jgi:hypothetical protein
MVTCLAFYPEDNNKIVVGYDDSSIIIINVRDNNQVYISLFIQERYELLHVSNIIKLTIYIIHELC